MKVRRRQRPENITETVPKFYSALGDCDEPTWSDVGEVEVDSYQWIVDEISDRPSKLCKNFKVKWYTWDDSCYVYNGEANWPICNTRDFAPIHTYDEFLAAVRLESPNFSRKAYKEITDIVPLVYDLATFLREIKEIKDMFDVNFFKKLFGKSGGGYGSKDLSGDYLNYNFGWAPTIGDLRQVKEIMEKCSRVLESIVDYQLKPQKGHYSEGFEMNLDTRATEGWNFPREVRTSLVAKRTATAKYTYRILNLDEINGWKLKAMLLADTLGFSALRNFVFNAIPFSFVAAWFSNIDEFLCQFDEDFIQCEVTITEYCESIKGLAIEEIRSGRAGGPLWHHSDRHAEFYWRSPCQPDDGELTLELGGDITLKRVLLSAAMLRNLL